MIVTRKLRLEKQEHAPRFTFKLARPPYSTKAAPRRCACSVIGNGRRDLPGLIDLKLSQNAQFQDRPGACKLIETAAGRGDQAMTPRLAECRAN